MKKTLLAATLAAAVSGAFAADVTLYGVADVGLRYTNTKTDGVPTDKLEMMSGHNAGSRFGLKGSEDLGNGWKAGFQLEGQYLVDTGALKNAKFFLAWPPSRSPARWARSTRAAWARSPPPQVPPTSSSPRATPLTAATT